MKEKSFCSLTDVSWLTIHYVVTMLAILLFGGSSDRFGHGYSASCKSASCEFLFLFFMKIQ